MAAIDHEALPCPARGLEFVLYAADAAPAYAINLNTGERMARHVSFDPAEDPRFWFVLDVSIARDRARALYGVPAREAFPAIAPESVRSALTDSLAWYRDEGGVGAETVLAACRALRWLREGTWSSKAAAARWADDDTGVVAQALAVRETGTGTVDAAAAHRFVDTVLARLRA